MEFTKFDFTIIITMSIAVVCMAFVFPALGLTDADAEESDLPDFNVTADRFDFAGDFPDRPDQPTEGQLIYVEDQVEGQDDRQVWLQRETDNSYVLALVNDGDASNPDPNIILSWLNATGTQTDETNLAQGEFDRLAAGGYDVGVEVASIENVNESDMTITAEWEVIEKPTDSAWYSIFPGSDAILAAVDVIGWLGTVLWWISVTLFQIIFNLMGLLFDSMIFFVDALVWLTTTYADIMSGANSWASVFVALPGLLLFMEFVKVVFIGISLLPTT